MIPKSPNREVGDRSFQPTKGAPTQFPNPPTGRLGIVHSSLQRRRDRGSQIPQPEGWGLFIPAYKGTSAAAPLITQPARLGIVHSGQCDPNYISEIGKIYFSEAGQGQCVRCAM